MKRMLPPVLVFAFACAAGAGGSVAMAQTDSADPEAVAPAEQPAATPTEQAPSPAVARHYVDLRRIVPIHGDAAAGKAKAELCSACHGADGVAIAPTFPNLAGQRIDFLYWQLVEFKRGALPDSPMTPPAASLDEADMRDLAAYYASLPPPAATATDPTTAPDADAAQLQLGQSLYLDGDPGKGIPPCQGCHGTDARGHPAATSPDHAGYTPYAVYPALRGQQALYLQGKLGEYHDGKLHDSTTDFVMSGVGQRLDAESIAAVSAWLSSQAP